MIIQMYKKIGAKWSEISKFIPGRPENMIKNRYHSYIKKSFSNEINLSKEEYDSQNNTLNNNNDNSF